MNSPPSYRWVCHRCAHINSENTEVCARCDFSAIASRHDIEGKNEPPLLTGRDLLLAFPEGIIGAGFIFFISPLWALSLLYHGQFAAGAGLIAASVASGVGIFKLVRSGRKFAAYVVAVAYLILAILIGSQA